MSKFTVEAVFKAIDHMTGPLTKMQSNAQRFTKGVQRQMEGLTKASDGLVKSMNRVGAAAAAVGATVGLATMNIVRTGAEFDKTLAAAAAKFDPAIRRGTAGFEQLRVAAERVGESTEFNAQQAAQALKDLASAGFSAKQAIASLPGVVDLATASEVDLGVASEMATKTLGAFGLMVEDSTQLAKNLTRVTDVMAEAAGKTTASMEGLFESVKEGAPVAVTAGASMETFMAMAASMASGGIEGSVAGTTLKNVFLALSAPTDKAANQLRKLGVRTRDAKGNMRDAILVVDEIGKAVSKLGTADKTAALEKIFGKIPLAGVSKMIDMGGEKLAALRRQLEASEDATRKMADTMRDTVAGDIDGFTSAVDGVKIALFSLNNGPIRSVIQGMTEWVGANKKLITSGVEKTVQAISDNLPTIATWLTRIGKVVAVLYGAALGIKAVSAALAGLNALLSMTPVGLIVTAIVGAIALLWAFWPEVSGFLKKLWAGLSSVAESIADAVGGALLTVWGAVKGFFVAAFEVLVGALVLLVKPILDRLQPVFTLVTNAALWVVGAWTPVGEFFSNLWSGIASWASGAFDSLLGGASSLAESVMGAWTPVGEFFSNLWSGIAGAFTEMYDAVYDKIAGLIELISGTVSSARQAGREALGTGSGSQSERPQVTSTLGAAPLYSLSESFTTSVQKSKIELLVRDPGRRTEISKAPRGPLVPKLAYSGT